MLILCLETGGTKLVAALADRSGRLLERRIEMRRPNQDAHATMLQICRMGRELLRESTPAAVSVGFGGTVDRSSVSPTLCYHEESWELVDAKGILSDAFRVPVFIENDCNLAALAEYRFGVSKPTRTLFYLTVGTGIGGGLVHQGRLVELGNFGEAEIGHIVVDPEGLPCACGNRGCLETICSGPGLEKLSRRIATKPITAKRLMRDLREGDPLAQRICETAATYMAQALAPAITLFSPDTIVFGGGVMLENEAYLARIRLKTLSLVFPPFRPLCSESFLLSSLRQDVVCQGAAVYALQRLAELEAG